LVFIRIEYGVHLESEPKTNLWFNVSYPHGSIKRQLSRNHRPKEEDYMKRARRLNRLCWPWVLIGLFIVVVLLGCADEEPIRIGFVAGISGRVADLGISGRDAAQLVIEQCNQAGGIAGRKVQLVIKNDQQRPEVARQAVEALIEENVVAIIGPMTSDMGIATTPLANAAEILMVGPTITTELLSAKDDYFFRVSSTTRDYASRSAGYQISSRTMRSIAAAYDLRNRSFCENWLANFKKIFMAGGGQVLVTIGFETGADRTFLEIARELLEAEPDGILIIANSVDAALLCQQIRKLDAGIAITLADWGATERLLELGGKAVEGVTVVQTFDRDSQAPRYQAFRKAFMERYHREPGFPGVYTHDAVQVILTALRLQKKGQTLKETILANRQFEGLQGEFSFDDFGDVKRPHASISIIRNRQFVVVE
jgi:branched-chain amino acid transport system substrate-binding protein